MKDKHHSKIKSEPYKYYVRKPSAVLCRQTIHGQVPCSLKITNDHLYMYIKYLIFKFTNGLNHINKLMLIVMILSTVVNIHKFNIYL